MGSALETAKAAIAAFNAKDWNRTRELMASGSVYDEKATGRSIQGADEIVQALQAWATAFPDATGNIMREIEAGDTAVIELVWRGTQTGPLETPNGPLPPSGRKVEFSACEVFTVKDGKVKSDTHYFDLMTMLTQIGAMGGP
jgi:steroid delta-isomerase-like uncharacterized protein